MIKKLLLLFACLLSASTFAANITPTETAQHAILKHANACDQAAATTDAGFCPSFKAVAKCHCVAEGLPPEACDDMSGIYDDMIAFFTTLENACANQTDTDPQTCIDDWNCYRNGGSDSKGGLCSASGSAC
jgi:AICAR transformylase/IMP cyclohydrolase PurH